MRPGANSGIQHRESLVSRCAVPPGAADLPERLAVFAELVVILVDFVGNNVAGCRACRASHQVARYLGTNETQHHAIRDRPKRLHQIKHKRRAIFVISM